MTDLLLDRVVAAVGDVYDVEGELGRGGTAVVYRARDVRLRRPVAVKVLPPELAFRQDVRSRFLREAQMAAQLSHPNIVPIYSVDERDGLVYFVMGLVEGESLGSRLLRDPRPPVAFVRRLLAEVAGALAYAHARGVVHRDIKPDNILLDRDTGRALVTDFGIARALEEGQRLTATGVAVGTPAFMSPEQALGERDVDARSDVYALGVLGYLLVAGELPFRATNTPAMLMKHISEPPPTLRGRRADVPEELLVAIERALRKQPELRWPDAGAMRDVLLGGSAAAGLAPPIAERPGERDASQPTPSDRSGDPFPAPPPSLAPGGPQTREVWRAERRRWRERMRERGSAPAPLPAHHTAPSSPGQVAPPRHGEPVARPPQRSLGEQLASFRGRLVRSSLLLAGLTFINVVTVPIPWVLFPAIGIIGSLRRRWRVLREAGIGWGDVLRGRVPAHLGGRDPAVERARVLAESRASRVQAAWADPGVVARRVRRFRTWALVSALVPVAGLAGAFAAGDDVFALAMVMAVATGTVTIVKGLRLRRLGLRVRDMLRSGWEQAVAAADPRPRSAVAAADAARLVPADVLAGPHGAAVRRAAEHRAEVRDVVRRMSAGDRAMIPDVQPTVDALVERVALLAQTLHRLDADIGPDLLPTLETRIRAAEAEAGTTPDGARRLTLLHRQRATIEDLLRRRATLLGQLESASLVLQSIKLDLIKLRSAGMQAALEDVNHATQEARALSRDIGHVLDAAAEVKAL